MDWHAIATGLMTVLLSIIGWTVKTLFADVEALSKDLTTHRMEVSDKYVRKEDYKADIADIKAMLNAIFNKLDNKVDK